jgi:diguanylate cyclase (GGDEF)-like protein
VPGEEKALIVPEGAGRREIGGPSALEDRRDASRDRLFGRLLVISASAMALLLVAAFAIAPASERPGLLIVAVAISALGLLATWFLKRGFSNRVLVIAGVILMALGVMIGVAVADGLDAAVILPLTGALIASRVLRGRLLTAMFVAAFVASVVGEIAYHVEAWAAEGSGSAILVISLVSSAVMLAFAYGLAWWISSEWLMSRGRIEQAFTGQRHLLALNERFIATLDPQQVLHLIADSLKSVVRYDNLTIYRVDREAGLLRPVLARDRFAQLILEITFPLDHGITGWVVAHAEAQCVNDTLRDPRMSLIPGTPAEEEALLVVPLVIHDRVGGTLNIGRMGGAEAHFDAADVAIAQMFAKQASVALQNAETHRAVSTRAETDALTGLRNRGAFEEDIAALLADQGAQPLTLLMLDLDGFKAFNDRLGHPAGDALLRKVARAISDAVRARDLVSRYGGDEFAILLPGTTQAVGVQVAERIRAGISRLDSDAGISARASLGVAGNADDLATRDALVGAADAALYRAKESGGDRVAVAEAAIKPTLAAPEPAFHGGLYPGEPTTP